MAQERGELLSPDQRAALTKAKEITDGEIRRWERGEPLVPPAATPEGTPVPAVDATGTPVPGTPTGTPIPEMPQDIGPVYGPEVPDPNGRIQVRMPDGFLQEMTRAEYERFTPEERAQMEVVPQQPAYAPGLPQDIVNPPPPAGVGPGSLPLPETPSAAAVSPDTSAPAPAPAPAPATATSPSSATAPTDLITVRRKSSGVTMEIPRDAWDALGANMQDQYDVLNARSGVGATPAAPTSPTPPASIAPPNPTRARPTGTEPPISDPRDAPGRTGVTTTPPRPGPPKTGTPAPAQKAPTPAPAAKPATPAPPPSPWESDPEGAQLPVTSLTRAVNQAGGRPTQKVTQRAAREIGEVFRPGEQGGYRGDTGGWRTLAHAAANAWEEQYQRDPNSLKASERAAYERDKASLHRDILKADSPFRDYRESWIGATRAGQLVPQSQEFVGALDPYGVPRPREMTPQSNTRPGTPLPGTPGTPTISPSAPPSQTATSPSAPIDLSEFGAVPESELRPQNRPGSALDLSEYGGVPESEIRTPSSATRPGAPLEEPGEITVVIGTDGTEVPDLRPPDRGPGILQEDTPLSRRNRGADDRMALMRSDANAPWPEPGPRARDAARVRETSEIVDQGRAEGRTDWEIAETLEMAGYGDAEQWYNALAEEHMRDQQRIYEQYPPDGSGPGAQLDTTAPPGEEEYYGPNIQVETPRGYEDSDNGLYDEGGYPLFKTYDDSGDYATYDQSFYQDEPTYAEYEDEGDYEVAEYQPEYESYDYEYEYA